MQILYRHYHGVRLVAITEYAKHAWTFLKIRIRTVLVLIVLKKLSKFA
jgi:hypothetical protein